MRVVIEKNSEQFAFLEDMMAYTEDSNNNNTGTPITEKN